MFEIGRICMKIAGRDAGKKCVIIDVIDQHYVMIDGQTRRRKCNINHLEPLNQVVQLNKNAPAPEVIRVLKENNIEVEEKKPKAKPAATAKEGTSAQAKTERPKRSRKKKDKPVKEAKGAKENKAAKTAKKKEAMKEEKKSE